MIPARVPLPTAKFRTGGEIVLNPRIASRILQVSIETAKSAGHHFRSDKALSASQTTIQLDQLAGALDVADDLIEALEKAALTFLETASALRGHQVTARVSDEPAVKAAASVVHIHCALAAAIRDIDDTEIKTLADDFEDTANRFAEAHRTAKSKRVKLQVHCQQAAILALTRDDFDALAIFEKHGAAFGLPEVVTLTPFEPSIAWLGAECITERLSAPEFKMLQTEIAESVGRCAVSPEEAERIVQDRLLRSIDAAEWKTLWRDRAAEDLTRQARSLIATKDAAQRHKRAAEQSAIRERIEADASGIWEDRK